MRETISIDLPEQTIEELTRFAEAEGVPFDDVVVEALQRYFFLCRLRKVRARLVPLAEAQGIYSDEDVFSRLA
jgi:hypothetical protein